MTDQEFAGLLSKVTQMKQNRFHPFVWINGEPEIGEQTYIGGFSEVNANGAKVIIGSHCDIASFVAINCADSHQRCIERKEESDCLDIVIEDHVFIGSHAVICGGANIGHHSVVGAGTIVKSCKVPPYSLIIGNPMVIKSGYYLKKKD